MTTPPTSQPPLPTFEVDTSHYTPGPEVTNHAGGPLVPDMRFAVAPPPQIGEITSADSPLRLGKTPQTLPKRLGAALIGAAVVLAFAQYIGLRTSHQFLDGLLSIIAAVIGGIIGWFVGRPKLACTFVGEEGVAEMHFDPRQQKVHKEDVLPFAQAESLRVSQTRHYTNGIYTGTEYNFRFQDSVGKPLMTISGRHSSQKGQPKPYDRFWFGVATEIAWSQYMLPRLLHRLGQGEPVRFALNGQDYVSIDRENIELHLGKKHEVLPFRDFAGVTVHQGTVTVARRDAKSGILGIGRSGYFSFPYANLSNGRLFLVLMNRLTPGDMPTEQNDASDVA